jgi:phosphate transport system permease protein
MPPKTAARPARAPIARPPTRAEAGFDRGFRVMTRVSAVAVVLLLLAVVLVIGYNAAPAVEHFGLRFLVEKAWAPNRERFAIFPEIFGTLYSSFIALVVGGGLGVGVAILLSQRFLHPRLERVMKNVVELLAAIPSVVYGLWGIYVVIPAIKEPCAWIHAHFSFIPFFSTPPRGPGMLPAALVLAIMILPTVAAVSREAIAAVPSKLSEAAYGLGATRWETILGVVLPTASTGIFGGLVLGFGRALGETMALAMLIGNSETLASWSIFSPGCTLASLLANKWGEAQGLHTNALLYAAVVLLLITLVVNVIGSLIMARVSRRFRGLA